MGIGANDDDFEGMAREFDRELTRARKKAGRKVGGLIKRKRKAQLRRKGYGSRRQAAVRTAVGRDGTLVALDLAPFAAAQEEGDTIYPTSAKMMTIPIDGNRIPRTGLFSKKMKDGRAFLFQKRERADAARVAEAAREMGVAVNRVNAVPVARLVESITFDASSMNGYRATVATYLDKYVDEIDDNLYEGR